MKFKTDLKGRMEIDILAFIKIIKLNTNRILYVIIRLLKTFFMEFLYQEGSLPFNPSLSLVKAYGFVPFLSRG